MSRTIETERVRTPSYPVTWHEIIAKIQVLDERYPHAMQLLRDQARASITLGPSGKFALYNGEVTVAEWAELSLAEKERIRSVYSWGKTPSVVFREWLKEWELLTVYWQEHPTTVEVTEASYIEQFSNEE